MPESPLLHAIQSRPYTLSLNLGLENFVWVLLDVRVCGQYSRFGMRALFRPGFRDGSKFD